MAQDCQRVEIYSGSQAWELTLFTQEIDKFRIDCVGLDLTLTEIYQDVEFDEKSRAI
ncbi:MAG: hypothetical protein GQ475_08090 [Methylococcaceae bacterium]|nr:hypothetical protein [Methylococcaceae bacterium]